jgi:hypothetical protein
MRAVIIRRNQDHDDPGFFSCGGRSRAPAKISVLHEVLSGLSWDAVENRPPVIR